MVHKVTPQQAQELIANGHLDVVDVREPAEWSTGRVPGARLPRHPMVEDDVIIYAGATILGRITIGKGAVIGGNVWLTRSVPAGANVTQARARQERFENGAGI